MEGHIGISNVVLFCFAAVTFSRMDPEGKLIMGFRKASSSVAIQVTRHSHFQLATSII
jgi:hypothetical protein